MVEGDSSGQTRRQECTPQHQLIRLQRRIGRIQTGMAFDLEAAHHINNGYQRYVTNPIHETISNRGLTLPEDQQASFLPGCSRTVHLADVLIQRGSDDDAELQAVAPGLKWSRHTVTSFSHWNTLLRYT
jgi:hypothetical protein